MTGIAIVGCGLIGAKRFARAARRVRAHCNLRPRSCARGDVGRAQQHRPGHEEPRRGHCGSGSRPCHRCDAPQRPSRSRNGRYSGRSFGTHRKAGGVNVIAASRN